MKYDNEIEIMNALEIDSWRNLSKDKMLKFAAMMPDVDTEVALKIVEQFPEFKSFALDALAVLEKSHESTLGDNTHSQDQVHRAFRETREILKGQLEMESLSWEERKYILDLIVQTANAQSEKDSENKRFLDSLFKKVVVAGVSAVVLGVVFVGGKIALQNGDAEDT